MEFLEGLLTALAAKALWALLKKAAEKLRACLKLKLYRGRHFRR